MRSFYLSIVFCLLSLSVNAEVSNQLTLDGKFRIKSKLHLISDIQYKNHYYNAVVEVPAGTTAKWEVNKKSGHLEWEFKKGKPRNVKYLGYPGNYGFIPQTLVADGGALDIVVLGEAKSRGEIQPVKVIGALMLRDKGIDDYKILAIPLEKPFKKINSIGEMVRKFPGVIHIVRLWFEGYKKPGKIQFMGYMKQSDAVELVEESHVNWIKISK